MDTLLKAFEMRSVRVWERVAKNCVSLLNRGVDVGRLKKLSSRMFTCLLECEEGAEGAKAMKSLTYLFTTGVRKYSEYVGQAALELLSQVEGDKRRKFIKLLKPFASQETAWRDSVSWSEIAEIAGIVSSRKIRSGGECCASLEDAGELKQGTDPQTLGAWNTNGLRARWQENPTSPRDMDPRRIKKALPFRDVLARAGNPDVFFAIEAKITLASLIKLKGFDEWREQSGYRNVYALWSGKDRKDARSNEGYAGVVMFSKQKPEKVFFGFENNVQNKEGRVITAVFPTMVVIGSYSPCSGWGQDRQQRKRAYEIGMKKHIKRIRAMYPNRGIIEAGDLNVNPRPMDCSEKAKAHWRRHVSSNEKAESTAGHVPGCRSEEVKCYEEWCKRLGSVVPGENPWHAYVVTAV